jgi:hypothetical protein
LRWLARVIPVLALVIGLTGTAYAQTPDGTTPETAIPLTEPLTNAVTGNSGGAFVYYTFNYPGDGRVGTISLGFAPTDQVTEKAFGVDLWQNGRLLATAIGPTGTPGASAASFSSSIAGPILAQVFNYNPGVPVGFQISLTGVTQAPSSVTGTAVAGVSVSAPGPGSSASNAISLATPQTGTLPGNTGGSYVFFTFDSPGGGSTQSVTLDFTPTDTTTANAIFVNLFENGVQVASGHAVASSTPGQLVTTFVSTNAGPVTVQLANFNATGAINFSISHP